MEGKLIIYAERGNQEFTFVNENGILTAIQTVYALAALGPGFSFYRAECFWREVRQWSIEID